MILWFNCLHFSQKWMLQDGQRSELYWWPFSVGVLLDEPLSWCNCWQRRLVWDQAKIQGWSVHAHHFPSLLGQQKLIKCKCSRVMWTRWGNTVLQTFIHPSLMIKISHRLLGIKKTKQELFYCDSCILLSWSKNTRGSIDGGRIKGAIICGRCPMGHLSERCFIPH